MEWNNVQKRILENLVESMPNRLFDVILRKGGPADYWIYLQAQSNGTCRFSVNCASFKNTKFGISSVDVIVLDTCGFFISAYIDSVTWTTGSVYRTAVYS
ncbi:hypothetical protein COOONC_01352 [Cooperia oncophora]